MASTVKRGGRWQAGFAARAFRPSPDDFDVEAWARKVEGGCGTWQDYRTANR